MKKVSVTLKKGSTIEVLPAEVPGLRKAGLLKEGKQPSETKEFKPEAETKTAPKKPVSKKRPASISTKNVKGNSPKKVN